ncbi:MAG: F0F1 ATP synthase subunit B [Candidatus Dormibacteria bacterium]
MIAATPCPADIPNCSGMLDFNLTLVFELGLFLVLSAVLWRLVWRPIVDVIEARDRRLAAGERAAAEAERRYRDGLAEVQRLLEGARRQAREALAQAHQAAAAAAADRRAAAQAEARRLVDEALAEVRREREMAVAGLRSQAQGLAVAAAARLLGGDLDEERSQKVAAEVVGR